MILGWFWDYGLNESQKLVRTILRKLLLGFYLNFTEMISTKSCCVYYQHFPVQWFCQSYGPLMIFIFKVCMDYSANAIWMKFYRIDNWLKSFCISYGFFIEWILDELWPLEKNVFFFVFVFYRSKWITKTCPDNSSETTGGISSKLYRNDQYQV